MATATLRQSNAQLFERVQEIYKVRSWFVFSWMEKVCENKMGNDLIITTDENIDRVFINGKQIELIRKMV